MQACTDTGLCRDYSSPFAYFTTKDATPHQTQTCSSVVSSIRVNLGIDLTTSGRDTCIGGGYFYEDFARDHCMVRLSNKSLLLIQQMAVCKTRQTKSAKIFSEVSWVFFKGSLPACSFQETCSVCSPSGTCVNKDKGCAEWAAQEM